MIQPGDIIIDRYRVLEDLKGQFSKTFEVEDMFKNDHKVMKVLIESSNPKLKHLFQREFAALTRLEHPGIPKGEEYGYFIFRCPHTQEILRGFVMEKIDGQDLGKWLEDNQRIANTAQAIEWLEQLITILSYVHGQKYLHRDIKPRNIMLKDDGKLVLIDFGIVKELIEPIDPLAPATIIGTPQNTQKILRLIDRIKHGPREFRPLFVFSSVAFNFVFLTLLARGVRLEEIPGLQVFFVVIICVISGFLVVPWIKYYLL
ncbi:protein kinase [Anabaena sp. AL93]|uniref:serine/threonine protein kinase n=1 Tax=Anabaena sp. AL93 TaxID=1678133 RepID=UPI000B236804|nr:protein kinase [Anabaena sp. AL93]